MSKISPGIVAGWLDPTGIGYYCPDTHTDWAAKYLKLTWSSNVSDKELVGGLKIDKILYDRGWCRIIIDPSKNILYFDTLNVPWKNLTRLQRRWLYDIAINGYEITGDKILPGSIVKNPSMKLQFGYTGRDPEPEDLIESELMYSHIMKEVLLDEVSFRDLLNISKTKSGIPGCMDNSRMDRAKHVRTDSLGVKSMDEGERWTFSYKSRNPHSTTRERHRGYVQFVKEDVSSKENAEDLDCRVHCSCPDYFYRWEYNNAKSGAGDFCGAHNKQSPKSRHQGGVGKLGEGLCKHLIALGRYLETKIKSDAPEPDDIPEPSKVKIKSKPYLGTTSIAPDPNDPPPSDDSYSDSRSGSDTLQESSNHLYKKMDQFVRNNPQFEVWYQ